MISMTMMISLLVFSAMVVAAQGTTTRGLRTVNDEEKDDKTVGREAVMGGSDDVLIESFDNPIHKWEQMNDPVMGGKSTGTFEVEDGVGKFRGEVVDVPFLHAPGFIQARTAEPLFVKSLFPDVSHCKALLLELRNNEDSSGYAGYRISFGTAHAPHGKRFAYGYKTTLADVPEGDNFGTMVLPFENFSDYWDDATGDAIATCQDDPVYCPDEKTLRDMKRFTVWGEGVAGKISLDIKSIYATGCTDKAMETETASAASTNDDVES